MRKIKQISRFILLITILLAALGIAPAAVQALPPRPAPTPGPPPAPPRGAIIELQVEGVVEGLWTVVQWEDAAGNWHDVEGWQGVLDEGNVKTWWVGEEHLGAGPFRWVATQDEQILATSDSFFLPGFAGQKLIVSVSISS